MAGSPEGKRIRLNSPDKHRYSMSLEQTTQMILGQIEWLLTHQEHPNGIGQQKAVRTHFRTSAWKIRAIGVKELSLGNADQPQYTAFLNQWNALHGRAFSDKDYQLKDFDEYLDEVRDKRKKKLNKSSTI